MKILVTGGAGFIGSHLVDHYLSLGHDVVVVDNLHKGRKEQVHPAARFYQADITDFQHLSEIFSREQPQIVNHHAALAEVTASVRDPASTYNTNLLGTTNVLAAARDAGVKKFLFASTGGAIYGAPKELPPSELTPAHPLSPYGDSKLRAEEVIRHYTARYHLPHLIFRYANVYGARQRADGEAGVVAIFGDKMRRGERPLIFGDGTKTRDYVHVRDIVRANVLGLDRGENVTLNLGSGKETSDQLIYDTVARHLGFPHSAVYQPVRAGEVLRICLDATRAKDVLGWEPILSLEEGIRETLGRSL